MSKELKKLSKKEKKQKKKERKLAKKALQEEALLQNKNLTPFKSRFAKRLSISENVSVGSNAVSETENNDDLFQDNIPLLTQSDPLDSDSDSDDEENCKSTSPVAAAIRGRTDSFKRVRGSPEDNSRNTRAKSTSSSSSSSRLPTKLP